jgi:hypothetical protein
MASTVESTETTEGGVIIVTVRHLDSDSFTRSVDAAAKKAWRKFPHDVQARTNHTGGNYGERKEGRTCWSRVAFGPSFEAAYAAVGQAHLLDA